MVLIYQTDSGTEFECRCHCCSHRKRNERVHRSLIEIGQFASGWIWCFARQWNVGMFRNPQRVVPTLFKSGSKTIRSDRLVGRENKCADVHDVIVDGECVSIGWRKHDPYRGRPEAKVVPRTTGISSVVRW